MTQTPILWQFDQIALRYPDRANRLKSSGSSAELIKAITNALRSEFARHNVRIGNEHAQDNPDDVRVVVQFQVEPNLFDWFANARTGYRAQFRQGWEIGLAFNNNIIRGLKKIINEALPAKIKAWVLKSDFETCGQVEVASSIFAASLVPELSKIWFCTKLIGQNGKTKILSSGLVGPRLLLDDDTTWPAPCREENDCWLEIKGAFLGHEGPYQPKNPKCRAKKLASSGEA